LVPPIYSENKILLPEGKGVDEMIDWFSLIKNDYYSDARRIADRPMEVEDWMKSTLKPNRKYSNCCDFTKIKLKHMPNRNNMHDDIASYIEGIDCNNNQQADNLLQLLENIDQDGMELLNEAMMEEGMVPSIGELDANVKILRELLEFWQECEKDSTDKRGIPQ